MKNKTENESVYKIDERSKEDVLKDMVVLAKSYTPEWKFDVNNPDAGSVIGLIFANQTTDNIRRLNRVIEKYHTEFVNMYGISLRAAKPAESVVTMQVNDHVQKGISLKKGTQVVGESEEGEEIIYEFENDLFVTSARLTDILAISGKQHKCIPMYGDFNKINLSDGASEPIFEQQDEAPQNIPLFSFQGENIDMQALLLYHHYMFAKQNNEITLRITGNHAAEEMASILTNPEEFSFFYATDDGLCEFEEVKKCKDTIVLKRWCEERGEFLDDVENAMIVLKKTGNMDEPILLDTIEIVLKAMDESLDFLWNNKSDLDMKTCCLFGQQPALYDECFIGQEYLMKQAGAKLTLNFDLSFAEFSLQETAVYEPDLSVIKRKPKAALKPLRYECWIQEIAIEYFNGKGFKKLVCDHDVTSIFSKEENAGRQEISFQIPDDWEATTQGGYEGNCIRIQITRADNCYLQGVTYHYPILKNPNLTLSHQKDGIWPECVKRIIGNKVEDITTKLKQTNSVVAFSQALFQGDYVFLGFDRRLEQGPISFFMELEEQLYFHGLSLTYTYSTNKGFKPLKVLDQTSQLEHAGIIMFMPPTDFEMLDVAGRKRYWIRIEDTTHFFAREKTKHPILSHFYMNAANIKNIQTKDEQDYYIDTAAANMHFPLYSDNILSVEVWVNEKEQLSVPEMEHMLNAQPSKVRAEYNFIGEIEDFYVLWHEIESFDTATAMERCYVIDRFQNEVIFGDGVQTKIPQNTRSIAFKTKVTCCDGERGNLKALMIDKFRGAVFSIDEISNPVDAYGGSHIEDIKDALYRGSNILGSRKRLVSESDYIREAKLFSETIAQVACVTGMTKTGKYNSNTISLILLMKDYKNGSYSFRNVQEELKKHLQNCCEMTCKATDLQIVEPIFVKVSLHIWLTVADMKKSIEMKHDWLEKITAFFEPVGEEKQADLRIGKMPKEKQIRLMLSTLEEEAYITYYTVSASYTDAEGTHEVELEKVMDNPFMVCCNGIHQIHMIEK